MNKGILSGILTTSFGKLFMMIVNFITIVILARMLAPRDFGIVAMCSIFLNISNVLVDSGMAGSLVYQKDVKQIDKNTLFWFNIVISLVIYFILFFSAPIISDFYKEPQLLSIIRVIALSIVVHSSCFVQTAILMKELRYREQLMITLLSTVFATIVVVALAYLKYGVWALIAQSLAFNVGQVILSFYYVRFVPKFEFSFDVLKFHWNFGSKLLGSSLLNILYVNMYVQFIGRAVDVKVAGYYQQAKKLNEFPRNLIQYPMDKVFFPYLVKDDNLKRDWYIIFKRMSLFVIPMLVCLSLESNCLVRIILGEKWIDADWMAALMFFGTIGVSLEELNRSFIKATGKTSAILKNDVVKRILNLAILLFSVRWGVKGVLCAFIINGFLGWLMNGFVFCKLMKEKMIAQIGTVFLIILLALFSYALTSSLMSVFPSSVTTLFVQASFFVVVYCLCLPIFFRQDLLFVLSFFRKKFRR